MLSFSDLYERRADYVYFLCSRLERHEERIDRLNQDVWRRVNRQLPQLQSQSEEEWLCSKLVDSHRRLHRHHRTPEQLDLRGTSDEARLRQALMSLALEYRWPLVLREFAGFGYGDISDILSVPIGTVKARVARARTLLSKFRKEIAE